MVESESELIEKLKKSVIQYDEEAAKSVANEILRANIDLLRAIDEGIVSAAKIVGDRFERREYFLPEVMLAADAMKAASDILMAKMGEKEREELERKKRGAVVIATVKGDIHDIGKNIVAMLLSIYGYKIYDLGRDVDSMKIIEKALEVNAEIIALSALMSTTRAAQKEVIDLLEAMKIRDRFLVMVGGGSTNTAWAEEIGADGWAETAGEAVELAQKLVESR